MTLDELRAAYPGAADAVEAIEGNEWFDSAFARHREGHTSPVVLVQRLIQSYEAVERIVGKPLPGVRVAMDHPDFVRYVAAKLGAV